MTEYKILEKGFFESIKKFEGRINELGKTGWKVVSMSSYSIVRVLLEKSKRSASGLV